MDYLNSSMENKCEKHIHSEQITNFFSSMLCPKMLSFEKQKTSSHTLNVYYNL